jgi:hypothetical protein
MLIAGGTGGTKTEMAIFSTKTGPLWTKPGSLDGGSS